MRLRILGMALLAGGVLVGQAGAQPLVKTAVQVDPGNTKQAGQTFGYRLSYACTSGSGPCLGAQVVDLLPLGVEFVATVPASPTGDVAAIGVTPDFGGTGRTRVQFVMVNPLPAGNSGDLLVNVRFPNGSTPAGAAATNTADGVNLEALPGTLTTPPVTVTALAALQVGLAKTLTTGHAHLDTPESYRLRIANASNASGSLNLTALGPVVDTLPPGTVFGGATPAADCQPGCVGTTPATLTWTAPCALPLVPGANCDIAVGVVFPSATFPSGTSVTNSFVATGTPLGQPAQALGTGQMTHVVSAPGPNAVLVKSIALGSPDPPALNQTFSYVHDIANSGTVALDGTQVIDTLPVALRVASVTTGAYANLADFAAGVGVRVSYEKDTALGVFTLWGSSPNVSTSTTLTAPPPGLGAGEYLTRIRWEFGVAQVDMSTSVGPRVTGQVQNPSNAGGPVAIGDMIQNCSALTAVDTAGPTNVVRNSCTSFVLSGPFVRLFPAKEVLSGAGPFHPNQSVAWRLRVRSGPESSDPVPLAGLVVADLLPSALGFGSFTFDDRGTGLPAPQNLVQIPNFAGTGRTLLRFGWNAGSGALGVGEEAWINISTTIASAAVAGSLSNDVDLFSNAPGLVAPCSGLVVTDALDLDGDASVVDESCRATGTIGVVTSADLSVTKTATPDPVGAGNNLTYAVVVTNAGPDTAASVTLSDPLPAGTTFVSLAAPAGWSCATPAVGAGGTVACTIGALAVGSASFTLEVKVGAAVGVGTLLSNTATVATPTSDPVPGNESATATATVAAGGSFTVTQLGDSGAGSLRERVAAAPNGATVDFQAGLTGTITLTTGEITIAKSLTIAGPGARVISVDGNAASRVFNIASGSVAISGLTLANGNASGDGGAVEVAGGSVSLARMQFVASSATGNGGAVHQGGGSLTLVESSLRDNTAPGVAAEGGAVFVSAGTADVVNCTLVANRVGPSANVGDVGARGGALSVGPAGVVGIYSSTLVGNQAGSGGNVFKAATGGLQIRNSIFAGGVVASAGGTGPDVGAEGGTVDSADYNLIQTPGGATIGGTTAHDVTGSAPGLLALADNGGPTDTLAPANGSPVLNVIPAGNLTGPGGGVLGIDQRGLARPDGVNGNGDIGAFEAQTGVPVELLGFGVE